jgi:chromosome segregation ATPase
MPDKEINDLKVKVSALEVQVEQNKKDLAKVDKKTEAIYDLGKNMTSMVLELKHMASGISDIKQRTEKTSVETAEIKKDVVGIHTKIVELESRPSVERMKRWNAVWDKAVAAVVGAVLSGVVVYIITHVNL